MRPTVIRRIFTLLVMVFCLTAAFTFYIYAQEPSLTLEITEGDAASDLTVTYGDAVTLTATVNGVDLPEGASVTFALGNLSAVVPVDSEGRAVWTVERLTLAAQSTYTATATLGELSDEAVLTVARRSVTLEGVVIADREYNGDNDVTVSSPGTLSGLLAGDEVTLKVEFRFEDQDVGEHKRVVVTSHTLQGSKRLNYVFEAPELTASILPKSVTLADVVVTPFTYNGLTAVTVESYRLEGVLESERSAVSLFGISAAAVSPNAATAQGVVFDPTVTYLVGDLAANYTLVLPTDVTVCIEKATLTVTVTTAPINRGQAVGALQLHVTGFVNGERAEDLAGFALPVATVPQGVDTMAAGTFSFNAVFAENSGNATQNYCFYNNTAVELIVRNVVLTEADFEVRIGETVLSAADLATWQKTSLALYPKGDYVQVAREGESFGASLAPTQNGSAVTVRFSLRRADGTVSDPWELTYRLDTQAPVGDVLWRGNSLLSAAPAYRYFSCSAFVLEFLASDGDDASGIALLEYALGADGPFVAVTDGTATVAQSVGLYTVYYRVTDAAGNVTLYVTDGMVLYTDAAVAESTLNFERLSRQDAVQALLLNGNLPARLLKENGEALEGVHYDVAADGTLTLYATYLNTLAAGHYTFTLEVAPLGQPYVASACNDAPTPVTLTLTVTRRAPTVADLIITPPDSMVYDGTEKTVTVVAKTGMGTVTVYYVTADGTRLESVKNAGTYVVMVDMTEGTDYAADTALVVGELVITKQTPAAPQVSYQAADGRVVGVIDGLLYSLDGVNYAPLPESLAGVVTDVCTIYIYLPGDGVNTEHSALTVIAVTRAGTPTVVPADETLFAACDGKIYALTEGLEYRPADETAWRAVQGSAISDLAPGTYLVRVAASGAVLESAAVQVVIAAAPEFVELTKSAEAAEQPAVTLQGRLTARALFSLMALTADGSSPSALRSLSVIDQRTVQVLGFFEPVLEGRYEGTLTLEIAVGDAYNGKTLTVYRETAEGGVETTSLLCEDGVVRLQTDTLTAVLLTVPMTTPHGIGSVAWIWVLGVILGLAVGACVAIEIRVQKKKRKAEK